MGVLRASAILCLVFLLAIVMRVRHEKAHGLERVNAASSKAEKAVLLAETARWTLPYGNERAEYLEKALEHANELKTASPEAARAVAEEVRATIYSVRLGFPGNEDILQRANGMIVDLLASRDALSESEKEALAETYRRFDGPEPGATAGSSLGFVCWLSGLWLSAGATRRRRAGGLVLASVGLALFLGFFALA